MPEDSYIRLAVFKNYTEDGSFRIWLTEGDIAYPYNKGSIQMKPEFMQEIIDDITPAANKVYSSQKVESRLSTKLVTADIVPFAACFEEAPSPLIHVFEDGEGTTQSVDYRVQDDTCYVSGTATGGAFILWSVLFPAGTYSLSTDQIEGTGSFVVGKATSKTGNPTFLFNYPYADSPQKTFTLDADSYLRFALYNGSSINKSFRIWANAGSEPLPYDAPSLLLTEDALPESVKELIEKQTAFMSVADFNTADTDMMNSNVLAILY